LLNTGKGGKKSLFRIEKAPQVIKTIGNTEVEKRRATRGKSDYRKKKQMFFRKLGGEKNWLFSKNSNEKSPGDAASEKNRGRRKGTCIGIQPSDKGLEK